MKELKDSILRILIKTMILVVLVLLGIIGKQKYNDWKFNKEWTKNVEKQDTSNTTTRGGWVHHEAIKQDTVKIKKADEKSIRVH
jgi:hypothetical protein